MEAQWQDRMVVIQFIKEILAVILQILFWENASSTGPQYCFIENEMHYPAMQLTSEGRASAGVPVNNIFRLERLTSGTRNLAVADFWFFM